MPNTQSSSPAHATVSSDHFIQAYTTIGLLHDRKSAVGTPDVAPTAEAIRNLGVLAQARNPEAISLLFNLAWGAQTPAGNAQLAIAVLLDAYAESDADVQALIQEQAWSLFDVVIRAPDAPCSGKLERDLSVTLGTSLPTEVLYLAGLHADHADHRQRLASDKSDIEKRLKVRLQPDKDAGRDHNSELANLLDRGRFTSQSELITVNQDRKSLPLHRSQLDASERGNAGPILEDLKRSIPRVGDARTVFINVGPQGREHWVTAVLMRAEGHDRFQCLLFDSLYEPPHNEGYSGEAIDLLSEHLSLTKVHVVGDAQLQRGAPNCCGVYATLVAGLLNEFKGSNPKASIDQMTEHLNAVVAQWKSQSDEFQGGMITAARARMVAIWAERSTKAA